MKRGQKVGVISSNILDFESYNKNLMAKNLERQHFYKIIEKFSPFMVFSLIILLIFLINNKFLSCSQSN